MGTQQDNEDDGTVLSDVIEPLKQFFDNSKDYVIDWVKRRNPLIQFIIAALVGDVVEWGLALLNGSTSGSPLGAASALVPSFSTTQILIAILGVLITQTVVQRKKFNEIQSVGRNMEQPAAADGGRQTTRSQQDPAEEEGTSGGAALGGAIAGGALGAAYGPQGAVAGAILGAILGDNLEEDPDDAENQQV